MFVQAADGIRTRDLVLTKDALYQLSYSSDASNLSAAIHLTHRRPHTLHTTLAARLFQALRAKVKMPQSAGRTTTYNVSYVAPVARAGRVYASAKDCQTGIRQTSIKWSLTISTETNTCGGTSTFRFRGADLPSQPYQSTPKSASSRRTIDALRTPRPRVHRLR